MLNLKTCVACVTLFAASAVQAAPFGIIVPRPPVIVLPPVLPPLDILPVPPTELELKVAEVIGNLSEYGDDSYDTLEDVQDQGEDAMREAADDGASFDQLRKVAAQYEKALKKTGKALQKEIKKYYKSSMKVLKKMGASQSQLDSVTSAFVENAGDIEADTFDAIDDVYNALEGIAEEL